MSTKEKSKKSKDLPAKDKKVKKQPQTCKNGFCCKAILLFLSILTAVAGVLVFRLYQDLASVPELPEVQLDRWWGSNSTNQDASVRPFRVLFTDAMEEGLRKKFDVYRAITNRKKSIVESFEYGTNSDALSQVFSHWLFKYSFKERQKFLNKFDHFKTNIQGLDIHFMHVKPNVGKNIRVYPILLLHGWPSSVREFYNVIPLLTTPREGHDFVFEVIVPSLPGFFYSQAPTKPGLTPFHIAVIMRNLMHRLGFEKFYIQGGDFGHSIGSHLATIFPTEVLGFHTNMPANNSKMALWTWVLGGLWPSLVANGQADRMYPLKEKVEFFLEEFGYLHLQATKPDTIGVALTDSPVGLMAYLLDRYLIFTDHGNKNLPDGGLSKISIPDFLDNVMMYWISSSITTAMRLYKEMVGSEEEDVLSRIPTPVPTWAIRFHHEAMTHPDFILRWKYPNLLGTTTHDVGGHFAGFERPKELADDVFLAVKRFLGK